MKQQRTIQSIVTLALFIFGAPAAFAHNGIEHILGTVTALTATSLTVETIKHASVTVVLDSQTTFTYKGEKALPKDLKVGERVAVNAKEAAGKKMLALSVKWGASGALAAAHDEHRMTWKGNISDDMCGADHSSMSSTGKPVNPHDCTLLCVKGGSKFVFVSEGKVFDIANQKFADLNKYAGSAVSLTGDLASDGKAITVSSIAAK